MSSFCHTVISLITVWLFVVIIRKMFIKFWGIFPCFFNIHTASEKMRSYGIIAMRIMAAGYLFCRLSTMISTYMQAIELLINGIWIAFPVTELL